MIDALVISVKEPQLDRCLESVRNQTIPFSNITHLDGVIPESESVNRGIEMINNEWVMKVDGDIILYKDAVETVTKYMEKDNGDRICGYYFGLYDTFLECKMGFCGVLRTSAYKSVKRKDKLIGDLNVVIELRKQGWIVRKLIKEIIGTHFDKPNEFQVFKRFYCYGKRANDNRFSLNRMKEFLEKTGDPLYSIGLNAVKFAKTKNRYYIGSRNVDFDRKLFEEFKNSENIGRDSRA